MLRQLRLKMEPVKNLLLMAIQLAGKQVLPKFRIHRGGLFSWTWELSCIHFLVWHLQKILSLLTYVLVQQPKLKAGEIGSDPVSKLFTSIMDNSLRYMNIVPNGEDIVEATVLRDYTGKDSTEAIAKLQADGFVPDSHW